MPPVMKVLSRARKAWPFEATAGRVNTAQAEVVVLAEEVVVVDAGVVVIVWKVVVVLSGVVVVEEGWAMTILAPTTFGSAMRVVSVDFR